MFKPLILAVVFLLLTAIPSSGQQMEIQELNIADIPKGMEYKGKFVDGARWRDKNGDNMLILTQTDEIKSQSVYRMIDPDDADNRDAKLYAFHFLRDQAHWNLLSKTYDYVKDCPFDLYASFLKGSLSITDLDSNGIAETSFLYKLCCRSDASPCGLKLIMHQGSKKYAIRGCTRVRMAPNETFGGEKKVDPAFSTAPRQFAEFCLSQWEKFVDEKWSE